MKLCLHCNEKSYYDDFCCLGCKAAYKIINNLGFSKYYQLKEKNISSLTKPDLEQQINIDNFVHHNNDNSFEINLKIHGLHCAACVWLIENIIKKNINVIKGRVNLTHKSLFLKWRGKLDDFYQITKVIHDIGYKLIPLDDKILKATEEKYDKSLFSCLAIAGFGAGNLMLLSFALWFANSEDMGFYMRNLLHLFAALIALPVIIFSGRPFFKSAINSLKHGYPNMDFVITLAIILATFASVIKAFKGDEHVYFDSAVMLIFFLLIGRFLEQKMRKKAFNIANEFSLLNANFGRVEIDGKIKIIPIKDLKKDMILIIAAGEKIAADGIIISGSSNIDNAIINGESQAQNCNIGDEVFAGTINIDSPIKVRVRKETSQSLLAKIIQLTQEIDKKQNSYIKIADKLAKLYIPITHSLALITFLLWYFYFKSSIDVAFSNTIAVLIITCPCALALAIPIVQTILTGKMLKRGIIIKSGQAIEKLSQITTVIFDKTGSITLGKPTLQDIFYKKDKLKKLTNKEKQKYLQIAASLCKNSNHPLAKSITHSYNGKFLDIKTKEEKGHGLIGNYNYQEVILGKAAFCRIKEFNIANNDNFNLNFYMKYGDDELLFTFNDELKKDAKEIIKTMQQSQKKVILLSGDNEKNVRKIAQDLKIDEYYSNQSPINKANFLKELKNNKEQFLMIGDGINDAPALALADISLSFNQASDLAQNISDIIIQGDRLQPIIDIINASQKSVKIMKQNLKISLFYNIAAIPFAIFGFVVPLFAALAMSSSSILVLINSLRIIDNNKSHP